MLDRPPGLSDGDVADALRQAWAVEPRRLRYAPLGFGSHHWLADDLFVTVDDADDADELEPALRTASALRHDAGLEFVVAPMPTSRGSLVAPIGDAWVVHLYERLDVVGDPGAGRHTDPEVVRLVAAIHDATPIVARHANREDFSIWDRDDLEAALADLEEPWRTGPYGERARLLLLAHAEDVRTLLSIHDRVAEGVPRDGWVVTHGEPHRGNIFRTTRGWAVVDWDTALVAPAERDLWDLPAERGDPALNELYRLRWDLAEIAVYIAGFYNDHLGDGNDERSWRGLVEHLDPRRRWPHLL